MDMEQALLTRLVDAATLAGDSVAWVEQPQGEPLPTVTLTIVSEVRGETMKGFQGLRFARVQADCRATTYAEAKALSDQVIEAAVPRAIVGGVNFRRASVTGPRDLGEATAAGFIHRKSLDLMVRHSPA
jgi:hypothetical protein